MGRKPTVRNSCDGFVPRGHGDQFLRSLANGSSAYAYITNARRCGRQGITWISASKGFGYFRFDESADDTSRTVRAAFAGREIGRQGYAVEPGRKVKQSDE